MTRVGILQAPEKSNEEILEDRRHALAASRSDQNRRKVIDAAAGQNPDHILGHQLLHIRVKAIEGTETGK